jgi:hypothetical protein
LPRVALPQQQLGRGPGDLVDLGAQGRPAQRAGSDQSLEAVDDLDLLVLAVTHHRDQLAVLRQRAFHLAQRLG